MLYEVGLEAVSVMDLGRRSLTLQRKYLEINRKRDDRRQMKTVLRIKCVIRPVGYVLCICEATGEDTDAQTSSLKPGHKLVTKPFRLFRLWVCDDDVDVVTVWLASPVSGINRPHCKYRLRELKIYLLTRQRWY